MALQELKVWAESEVVDGVTETSNRRNILTEEFENGWVRTDTPSCQQINSILFLLSSYSKINPFTPDIYRSSDTIPSYAIEWVEGNSIDSEESPLLYEYFGSTFPAVPYTLNTGWTFILRNM